MTTQTLTLTDFLLARIAEDEWWVRGEGGFMLDECQECSFGQQPDSPYSVARLLAECEAKRRIVERHESLVRSVGKGLSAQTRAVLRDLAAVYADHPDYREEWRP